MHNGSRDPALDSLAPFAAWCSIARVILAYTDEQIHHLVASGQYEQVSQDG
jgi:hypothetical protein